MVCRGSGGVQRIGLANLPLLSWSGGAVGGDAPQSRRSSTTYGYDPFGRLTSVTLPLQQASGTPSIYQYNDTESPCKVVVKRLRVENPAFTSTPAVLTQVQTNNGASWVKTRQRNAVTTGFDMALEQDKEVTRHQVWSLHAGKQPTAR